VKIKQTNRAILSIRLYVFAHDDSYCSGACMTS